jgi:cytochrome c-type biogenesis protein CcsB
MLFLTAFIVIIGSATFIENTYDTATSKLLIYNSKWFEFLLLGLVVLFIVNTYRKGLFRKEKLPQLVFHFSFIVLIIGGGITRYFGYEANMHIIEGSSVDVIYSVDPYFQMRTIDGEIEYTSNEPLYFSQISTNDFQLAFDIEENQSITVEYQKYIFHTEEMQAGNVEENLNPRKLSNSISSGHRNVDTLVVNIIYKGKRYEAVLLYDYTRYIQPFRLFSFDDLQLKLVYGPKPINLPFSLQLKDFTLSKYPGTNIPSASESRVVLSDVHNNIEEEHLIAKNRVLDYNGYRFFQTSYDDDEKGTILSVNYDYYGTRITYFGYFLMLVGVFLILFSKSSHFSQLDAKIKDVRRQRKSLIMTLILLAGIPVSALGQSAIQSPIDVKHADQFGHLLVQTYDGRFSSVHSLATDVIHKISGKDRFFITGKGEMGAMQVFMDILVDPEFWKDQRIIIVREKSLRNKLGLSGKYASFNDFLTADGNFKLEELSKRAFQTRASEQSTLDREVIKVTERANIFFMVFNGSLLKLFPERDSENYKWINWIDSNASELISEDLIKPDFDLELSEFNYTNIMRSYLISTLYARASNNYTTPNKIMEYIHIIQRELTPAEILPSALKVKLEVLYNKLKIFDHLKFIYAILGSGLLLLTFIKNFKVRSKGLDLARKIFIVSIIIAFVYQSFGMGLRWYLGGHAPWSNGYEVLLLVAWGGMVAGFSVIRYSKITLATTALLAFFILMTAGHSYYDPQITNLNPVLKSFWLIIHVAVITIGYGFLALSFLLGLINVTLHLFKTYEKKEFFHLVIQELTYINEKVLTIGMFLTAIGTFIGCVWANESWGNYWSWNAKQTWSLIIVVIYGVILHFKYIPKMESPLAFNIGATISFGSVLMTFIGVNYYFTKGLHSYATDDPPIFPGWAWVSIISLLVLIVSAIIRERYWEKKFEHPAN